jgi:hypothetical protein
VQEEAAPLFDRAAVVHADISAARRHIEPEGPKRSLDRHVADRNVHDEAERALGAVPDDEDDGLREPRIADRIGRDEEPPRERAASRRLDSHVRRRGHEQQRGEEQRGHRPATS